MATADLKEENQDLADLDYCENDDNSAVIEGEESIQKKGKRKRSTVNRKGKKNAYNYIWKLKYSLQDFKESAHMKQNILKVTFVDDHPKMEGWREWYVFLFVFEGIIKLIVQETNKYVH